VRSGGEKSGRGCEQEKRQEHDEYQAFSDKEPPVAVRQLSDRESCVRVADKRVHVAAGEELRVQVSVERGVSEAGGH